MCLVNSLIGTYPSGPQCPSFLYAARRALVPAWNLDRVPKAKEDAPWLPALGSIQNALAVERAHAPRRDFIYSFCPR